VLWTLSLLGQQVLQGPPGSVEGGEASVLGAALHMAAAPYHALTFVKACTITCHMNSGQKGALASTIKTLKCLLKIPHLISPPNGHRRVKTTQKCGPKEYDSTPPLSASQSTPNLLSQYKNCWMACCMNLEPGELAKLSSLKKRFLHQSHLWTFQELVTKTLKCSSEASHLILPSSGLNKVWMT